MIQVSDICDEFLMHYTIVTLTDVKWYPCQKMKNHSIMASTLTPAVIHTCPMLP